MSAPRATSRTRIGVLGAVFVGALLVVVGHLFLLMVRDQSVWARRSYENRWAFRSVPSLRGRLLDRDGVELARDEATTRVSVHYLRFRLRHCVGAAVHGGTVCQQVDAPESLRRYSYGGGPGGALAAAQDLLSMPVGAIEPGVLDKEITTQLATYATTVLSQLGGLSRRQAYRAMREAAQSGERLGIGDVLEVPREVLLQRFEGRLAELRELSDRLDREQRLARERRRTGARAGAGPLPVVGWDPTLLMRLEELRVASFEKEHVTWKDEDGQQREGSLIEELRTPVCDEVSFDVAAALRVDPSRFAGVTVEPSVRRVRTHELDGAPSFDALVGRVNWLDRTIEAHNRMTVLLTGEQPQTWVDRYLEEQMPSGWAEDLVPEGLVVDETRLLMIDEARRRYERELMVRERRGVTGFENWFNDDLMGQLGMRFVEHDGSRREQSLWSHLRVESGRDVQITIDSELQRIAERLVQDNWSRYDGIYRSMADPKRQDASRFVEAALAVIDAGTGDVLACAGAPVTTDNARHVPGVMWVGNGSIGSVAKPFVLVEHLESERLGRPHKLANEIEACAGRFTYLGQQLKCASPHWAGGQTPREALQRSCNCFFYQVGVGLGATAVRRAYERFGLLRPAEGTPYSICWQDRLRGVAAAPGVLDEDRLLPSQAIGYGVQVTPLFVARAYAGLATGALPTLGLRLGEQRDRVSVAASPETLDLVRQGLDDVVQRGTARERVWLAELGVRGKTGTAERTSKGDNNAWFAGYLPGLSAEGHQLAFCGVIYFVPDASHGGDTAGAMVEELLRQVWNDPALRWRYLPR